MKEEFEGLLETIDKIGVRVETARNEINIALSTLASMRMLVEIMNKKAGK